MNIVAPFQLQGVPEIIEGNIGQVPFAKEEGADVFQGAEMYQGALFQVKAQLSEHGAGGQFAVIVQVAGNIGAGRQYALQVPGSEGLHAEILKCIEQLINMHVIDRPCQFKTVVVTLGVNAAIEPETAARVGQRDLL